MVLDYTSNRIPLYLNVTHIKMGRRGSPDPTNHRRETTNRGANRATQHSCHRTRGKVDTSRAMEASRADGVQVAADDQRCTLALTAYRLEQPVTAKGKRWTPVNNHELACRLSYFLWSTMPDEELQKAMMGRIPVDDKTMVVQTKRMLKDSRTRRLAVEFACQWLGIRNFNEDNGKNEKLYPEFAELRGAMYEESVRFLEDIFRNDGSILDIIHADHTFLKLSRP